ncbi:hypothetical protein D3C84_1273900 [compost metagenome]
MILIEVPVKGDFITNYADFLILLVFLAGINPGVRHMRLHFLIEVSFVDRVSALARVKCDVFVVA